MKTYKYKLNILKDEPTVAKVVANELVKVVKKNPHVNLGLATGGTVVPIYELMVDEYKKHKTDYSHVKTFNMDEYIGLNHLYVHEGYRCFMNFRLFAQINIKMKNTHFPNAKNSPTYESIIKSNGGIDVQIVGFGHNGHIAFNEPGSSLNSVTRVINLTKSTIEANARFFEGNEKMVPRKAISMGIKTLLDAKKLIVVVTGVGKAKALSHLLMNKYDPQWPCTSLLFHKDVEVYVDAKTANVAKKLIK